MCLGHSFTSCMSTGKEQGTSSFGVILFGCIFIRTLCLFVFVCLRDSVSGRRLRHFLFGDFIWKVRILLNEVTRTGNIWTQETLNESTLPISSKSHLVPLGTTQLTIWNYSTFLIYRPLILRQPTPPEHIRIISIHKSRIYYRQQNIFSFD